MTILQKEKYDDVNYLQNNNFNQDNMIKYVKIGDHEFPLAKYGQNNKKFQNGINLEQTVEFKGESNFLHENFNLSELGKNNLFVKQNLSMLKPLKNQRGIIVKPKENIKLLKEEIEESMLNKSRTVENIDENEWSNEKKFSIKEELKKYREKLAEKNVEDNKEVF